ncbi:hypothetical protein TNIN_270801 [Trichonephila inaurata madagascariensis]|uniref:Uncharacterized protein n=1 Tax=Trichonephila inaurata madagascariensis TaxID=2747483 RepID=A0A8X6IWZ7_9ARAC|nr:hypothetical protein TNIN_270801 [Trichonephila inaurata madagascariensis]
MCQRCRQLKVLLRCSQMIAITSNKNLVQRKIKHSCSIRRMLSARWNESNSNYLDDFYEFEDTKPFDQSSPSSDLGKITFWEKSIKKGES